MIPTLTANVELVDLDQTDTVVYNEEVKYSCEVGYEQDTGDIARYCLADGNLNGTNLACTSKIS